MWRMPVLAKHLRWWGLLEIGLSMLDGSYYRESHDDRYFSEPPAPSVDIVGWGGDS